MEKFEGEKLKILILDVETAPSKVYAWGLFNQDIHINQIVEPGYTLCYSAKWYKKKGLYFDSLQKSSKKKMIGSIHNLIEDSDVVVTYNGFKFDLPVLNKEFILLGFDPPSNYKQVDLYRVARRIFRFPSNKLDYISQSLGLGSKKKHKGMDLWKGCMDGDESSWRTMEAYNKQDVRLLEKVYEKMLPWVKNHPNYGLYVDSDRPICRNCGSSKVKKNGFDYTSVGKYQRYKCVDCRAPLRGGVLLNSVSERRRLLR